MFGVLSSVNKVFEDVEIFSLNTVPTAWVY